MHRTLKQSDTRIKCDNKNLPSVLSYQYKGTFNEQKRLTSLNRSGTEPGEPCTKPPSCTSPQQPTLSTSKHVFPSCQGYSTIFDNEKNLS